MRRSAEPPLRLILRLHTLSLKLDAKLTVPAKATTTERITNGVLNSKVNSGFDAVIGPGVSTSLVDAKTIRMATAISALPSQRRVVMLIMLGAAN